MGNATVGKLNKLLKKKMKLTMEEKEVSNKLREVANDEIERLVKSILKGKEEEYMIKINFGEVFVDDYIYLNCEPEGDIMVEMTLTSEIGPLEHMYLPDFNYFDIINKLSKNDYQLVELV